MGDGIQNPETAFSQDRLDITTLGAMAVQIDKDLQLLQSLAE